ncbi:hypothetical protein LIER_24015 [Lithospermum erythrorhizon]|uniref:Replication factor A C-terminal domain-containing protein n=1 Tax=Lithospermum erythrorhizon TaxID=34254 RepID=A0AAV3R3U4_LITER
MVEALMLISNVKKGMAHWKIKEQHVEHYDPRLMAATVNFSVVAKRLKVKIYHELKSLLEDDSADFTKDLVDRNLVRKYFVGEIELANKCGNYWTRAFLQLPDVDRCLYYIECNNCHVKLSSLVGAKYHCAHCDKDDVSSRRPYVAIDVYDHIGHIQARAIENVIEQIL